MSRSTRLVVSLSLLSLLALASACAAPPAASPGDADAGADAAPADGALGDGALSVPLAGEIEPGVYRELVTIAAPAAPPSPSGATSPPHTNVARFLRYRASAEPRPVRAIVIAMPGMPAGAMSYDQLARRLLVLSGGDIELWAIDRRANTLEDLTGMNAAEARRDPDLAWRYYDEGLTIAGKRYQGLPASPAYMSEWGLATHVSDLRAMLALIPAAERRARVLLIGHSFGAAFVQAYAAWNIGADGAPRAAASELAGVALLDGGLFLYPEIDEATYRGQGSGLAAGLDTLRAGKRLYLDYVGLGLEAFLTVEVTALRASIAPHAVVDDPHVDRIATLLFLRAPPPMTSAALVGFTLDEDSSPVRGLRARCGAADGPTESYRSPLTSEMRLRPARDDVTYDWLDYDEVDPPENTSIKVLARVAHEGPTNRIEWFMPARLVLDVAAVSSLSMTDASWQRAYGLRATANGLVDAPLLVVSAGRGIAPSAAAFDGYRQRIAATVGEGRPRAGATRARDQGLAGGFAVLDLPDHAHDDLVHGSGERADQQIYQPLLDWLLSNVAAGRVLVGR
ncbi:MAG: hypothetical protein KC503_18185 [Myxococcales bacterium]|nr:hypothetical protein [Myxococcales bacterium]